jgi:Tectonin domain
MVALRRTTHHRHRSPTRIAPMKLHSHTTTDAWITRRDLGLAAAASLLASAPAHANTGSRWVKRDGKAMEVAVGANGSVWVLGEEQVPGGQAIFVLQGNQWRKVEGGAVKIAVDGSGNPWIINDTQSIFQWVGQGWTRRPGKATDIAVGKEGAVMCIGQKGNDGNGDIFEWGGQGGWTGVGGRAVHIAVDPQGFPWVVNVLDQVWRHNGRQFVKMPGAAVDIAIGANGAVWTVGTDRIGPDRRIHVWNGNGWNQVDGGARVIAVGPDGLPWVAQENGFIYQRV